MDPKELKELLASLNSANAEIKQLREKYDREIEAKASGEQVTELKTQLEAKEQEFKDLSEKYDNFEKEFKEFLAEYNKPNGAAVTALKTAGMQFVESELFTSIKAANRGSDQPFECKDITSASNSAGALQNPDRDPEVYRSIGGRRALRMRDIIPNRPISSGSVEIMRQDSFTNNAAPQTAELAAKAQSGMSWELVTESVKTIAHWEAASRQALSDAPMLQGLIDTELTYGLQLEMDDQILNGDGTGQNFTGVLVDGSVNDVGELPSGTATDDVPAAMIDHIRGAITECQKNEYYNITGVVLNPADWQIIETAKATDGHYILVPFAPSSEGTERIWRVPVIITNAIPVNNFILGDWTMAAKLYVREGITIRVSESHADYFVKNGVVVLAEERAVLGINRPKALTKGLFTVAP